jgi:hypothetical protein
MLCDEREGQGVQELRLSQRFGQMGLGAKERWRQERDSEGHFSASGFPQSHSQEEYKSQSSSKNLFI